MSELSDLDGSPSDKISTSGPLGNVPACPSEHAPAEHRSAYSSDDEDNTPTLK